MKKQVKLLFVYFLFLSLISGNALAQEFMDQFKDAAPKCSTILSGEIYDSNNNVIETGYDEWGYNYQAYMFDSKYITDYDVFSIYKDSQLTMKWNDSWLSNKDCDGDNTLDRHYGYNSYIGSGAWLTNYRSGSYEVDGNKCKWEYFVKIVAVPEDATSNSEKWYTADGTEIGPVIWGNFAIIQTVENDPCNGNKNMFKQLNPSAPKY